MNGRAREERGRGEGKRGEEGGGEGGKRRGGKGEGGEKWLPQRLINMSMGSINIGTCNLLGFSSLVCAFRRWFSSIVAWIYLCFNYKRVVIYNNCLLFVCYSSVSGLFVFVFCLFVNTLKDSMAWLIGPMAVAIMYPSRRKENKRKYI